MTDEASRNPAGDDAGYWTLTSDLVVLAALPEPATYVVYRHSWPDDDVNGVELIIDGNRHTMGQVRLPLDKDSSVAVSGRRIELRRSGVRAGGAGTYTRMTPTLDLGPWHPWRMRGKPRADKEMIPLCAFTEPRFVRVYLESVQPAHPDLAVRLFVEGAVLTNNTGQEAAFRPRTSVDLFARSVVVDFWPMAKVETDFDVRGWLRFASAAGEK